MIYSKLFKKKFLSKKTMTKPKFKATIEYLKTIKNI